MNLAYLADGKFGGRWGHANKLGTLGLGYFWRSLRELKLALER